MNRAFGFLELRRKLIVFQRGSTPSSQQIISVPIIKSNPSLSPSTSFLKVSKLVPHSSSRTKVFDSSSDESDEFLILNLYRLWKCSVSITSKLQDENQSLRIILLSVSPKKVLEDQDRFRLPKCQTGRSNQKIMKLTSSNDEKIALFDLISLSMNLHKNCAPGQTYCPVDTQFSLSPARVH